MLNTLDAQMFEKNLKRAALPLFSLFLIYQSYGIMSHLWNSNPTDFNQWVLFSISFLLSLLVTGIFAFVGFAYLTGQIMPDSYYEIKSLDTLVKVFSQGNRVKE